MSCDQVDPHGEERILRVSIKSKRAQGIGLKNGFSGQYPNVFFENKPADG